MNKTSLYMIPILFIFVLKLSGCSYEKREEIPEPSPTTSSMLFPFEKTPTITQTPMPISESTRTIISPTALSIESPEKIQQTALPSSTPTPLLQETSPIKTLSWSEKFIYVTDILKNNGGCRLPCIAGIAPGDSSEKADNIVRQFGASADPNGIAVAHIFSSVGGWSLRKFGDVDVEVGVGYFKENGNVRGVHLISGAYKNDNIFFGDSELNNILTYYSLPQVLKQYEKPGRVLIEVWRPNDPLEAAGSFPYLNLVLFYENFGSLISYLMPLETKDAYFVGCLTKAHLSIATQDLLTPISIEKLGVQMDSGRDITANLTRFKSIEEVTDLSLEEFYISFSADDQRVCIETSSNYWPLSP